MTDTSDTKSTTSNSTVHSNKTSRSLFRRFLPLLVLGGLLLLATVAVLNPPSARKAPPEQGPSLTVAVQTVVEQTYQVIVPSYGTVQPRTKIDLVSQVGGKIIWVNPQFRAGGLFHEGDTLLRLDARDYEADVQIAQAQLLAAKRTLAEEDAQSQQALADWNRLGDANKPSELVLRKPQLLESRAAVAGAEATLRKAELNLERSALTAPFDGRILSTEVDLGEVVSSNSSLAFIYATDYVEIRLPLANADLDFIALPEPGDSDTGGPSHKVRVNIYSSLSGATQWPGFLVRTESAIDDSSRQLHVVARVDDPFQLAPRSDPQDDKPKPVKIGEYVTAKINGRKLQNAIVIPNSTIYQGSYVYVVKDGLLQRKSIEISWQNDSDAVIASGLNAGEALVTTPLGQVTSGTRVAVVGTTDGKAPRAESSPRREPRR